MQEPITCKECGGACCKQRASFHPKDWEVVHKYGNPEQIKAKNFTLKGSESDGYWRSLNEGDCPALTETGCAVPYDEHPLLCRIYPYVPFRVPGIDFEGVQELFLATRRCPAWREFGSLREKAEERPRNATKKDN